jgi:hypothetical protein
MPFPLLTSVSASAWLAQRRQLRLRRASQVGGDCIAASGCDQAISAHAHAAVELVYIDTAVDADKERHMVRCGASRYSATLYRLVAASCVSRDNPQPRLAATDAQLV